MSTELSDPADVVKLLGDLIAQSNDLLGQNRQLAKELASAKLSESKWLDSTEAAKYLGISVKALYGIVELRQIVPGRATRRQYRFTKEMLDQYLCR